jgi:hypothetical protein
MLGPNSLFASHIASEIFSLYPMSLSPKRVWLRSTSCFFQLSKLIDIQLYWNAFER